MALAAGWTGGHVYPALALAEALGQGPGNVDIVFFGTADAIEATLVPNHGYRLETIDAKPMMGVGTIDRVRAGIALVRGIAQARHKLKRLEIDLVVGFGGYVTPPVLMAARTLGCATAIHEANMVPGRANRLLARFVDHVFLNWPEASGYFPGNRTTVTGHPTRRAINALADNLSTPPTLTNAPLHILVTGGSIGMAFLDQEVPALCGKLRENGINCHVRHQCVEQKMTQVQAAYRNAGVPVDVTSYIDDMPAAYGWANFAITGAGAGTLAELSLAGLPALLVPLDSAADDHQRANAQAFSRKTQALCCSVSDWNLERLHQEIRDLVTNADSWSAASQGMRRAGDPEATDTLARLCRGLIKAP